MPCRRSLEEKVVAVVGSFPSRCNTGSLDMALSAALRISEASFMQVGVLATRWRRIGMQAMQEVQGMRPIFPGSTFRPPVRGDEQRPCRHPFCRVGPPFDMCQFERKFAVPLVRYPQLLWLSSNEPFIISVGLPYLFPVVDWL